jgi:mono/diheme cytochrome c family protein
MMMRNRLYPAVLLLMIGAAVWLVFNPPRFWLNWTKRVEPTATVGAQLVEQYGCRSCHRISGQGSLKAPTLDGRISSRDDSAQAAMQQWLRNPKAVRSATAMPNFHLSDSEIDAILVYLASLHQP